MRLLLDTHVLLWWLAGQGHLSVEARGTIAAPSSEVMVSAASVWEISIKRAKGRLRAPDDLGHWIRTAELDELPVRIAHAELAGSLPPHHADPFDRILIAQAQLEGLTIVTCDEAFRAYGVPLLAA